MQFQTLQDWLSWQEQLHPSAIDLGLARVERVLTAMGLRHPPYRVLTVGGTNGKGSCVAYAEAILRAAGYRTGAYTSPHLLRYPERVRVDGVEASEQEFCDAFARIDAARGDISLTYFEFGTLAALDIFARRGVEATVLEVGLGGRLDAVNALDADAALVVSVGLDHMDWLGPDRESIGFEKVGIYRKGRPAISADRDPPRSLVRHAEDIGADLMLIGRDFERELDGAVWNWRGLGIEMRGLPAPALAGQVQYDNASAVVALLHSVRDQLPVPESAIRAGLTGVVLPARFQCIPGAVEQVFDVAHNADAARNLAANLTAAPVRGRTFGVAGMFRDKAAEEVARALAPHLERWYLGGLAGPRSQSAAALGERIRSAAPTAETREHASVSEAYATALGEARPGDRLVVFGSFQTVAEIMKGFRG